MLNPQGFVSECTGENIFVARDGVLITPPRRRRRARGHHPGHGDRPSPRTSASRCASTTSPAATSTSAEEMFVCGTAAEVSRGQLRRRPRDPVPRPDDHGHRRRVRQGRPRPGRPLQGLGGACPLTHPWVAAPGPTRCCPPRSRSSTRRCATAPSSRASRSPSRTSCASPSSSTGSACAGSRAATRRPTRRTRSSSGAPPTELHARRRPTLVAFGSTRRPAGKVDVDPTLAALVGAGTSHGVHRRQELGLPRHRGAAHHARRGRGHGGRVGRVPEGRRACGCSSTPSTSSTATRPTPSTPCACSRRPPPTAPTASCCATPTAARCPTRCSASPARSSPTSAPTSSVGIHTQNDTGCAVANSVAAVRRRRHPGAGHGQRLRRAHRQRQPHDRHPQPHAEAGRAHACPRAASSGSPSVSHHVAELVNLPPHPADPYVGASAFAHKGGLHTSALGRAGGATYEHIDPERRRQRHPRAGVRPRRPGRHGDEGQGVRRRARRPRRRRARPRTSSSSSPRASCSRRPTPRSSCSCAGPPAGSRTSSGRGLPGVELPPRGPGHARRRGRGRPPRPP